MQSEVYNATNTGAYTKVNTTAKTALAAPQTKEVILAVKTDMIALVTQGKVKFRDNAHLLLGQPNPQTVVTPGGLAQKTAYHDLDSISLDAIKLS